MTTTFIGAAILETYRRPRLPIEELTMADGERKKTVLRAKWQERKARRLERALRLGGSRAALKQARDRAGEHPSSTSGAMGPGAG